MAAADKNANWEHIQGGVNDVEKMITQKDYNTAMIKCRQTLEYMVKQLAKRAYIQDDGDLKDMINELYDSQWISKTTCEHYHQIRMIGNKAVHEDYSNAYDANQAYHMLSQEVYTFANDYSNARKGTKGTSRKAAGTAGRSGKTAASSSGRTSSGGKKRSGKGKNRGIGIFGIIIPVLVVILLVIIIRLFSPFSDKKPSQPPTPSTSAVTQTAAAGSHGMTAPAQTAAPETQPAAQEAVYKTTAGINVRREPTTESDNKIGVLEPGTTVKVLEVVDDKWTKIEYNGGEAYVASQYLKQQ